MFVTDRLDPGLDWDSFELTEFGFGDILVTVPAGRQYFQTVVEMTYNGRTFEVWIEGGINVSTRELFARFMSIDPATSLPPDVLTGFLPPEDGTCRGMGHVSYTIRPKRGLPSGTQIRNVAMITFDVNPPIATDQVDPHDPSRGTDPEKQALVTIDATPPAVAQVLAWGSAWSPAFLEFLQSSDLGAGGYAIPLVPGQPLVLPWSNVNRLSIRFSEDVVVGALATPPTADGTGSHCRAPSVTASAMCWVTGSPWPSTPCPATPPVTGASTRWIWCRCAGN